MKKLKSLNNYQKCVLMITAVMVLVFSVLYPKTISKVGFEYRDTILVAGMENGDTVYAGKINGMPVKFTVTEDKTVFYQHDDKTFGPYTLIEDPTAIPENTSNAEEMTGVELRSGEETVFRGGALKLWGNYRLYDEENALEQTIYQTVQSIEPTVPEILALMDGPELKHKGQWGTWLAASLLCLLNVISIFFAEELFRFSMAFHISDANNAAPSDWEIGRRYFGWTALTIMALVLYVKGLM